MKIGIVCYPSQGGSGVVATELGHALANRGHEIHFITYDKPFRLKMDNENIYFHKVNIASYDLLKYPDYGLNLAVKMIEIATKFDLDIIHVHYAIPHATSAYLAKQILNHDKPKIITTLHGTDITLVGKDPSYFPIVKYSIEKSCGITAVSQSLKEQTQKYFSISNPIKVIHNFFSADKQLRKVKPLRDMFVKGEEKIILHSSNFRAIKRPLDVLEIFLKINKKIPSKLVLLGRGPELKSLEAKVDQLNIQNEVYFVGESIYVDPYVASADLFLLPSEQESFGLSALEAMAYGVPVIATNVGGIPEVVHNGNTGYLSNVGDISKMAEDSIRLLKDGKLYSKISECAQEIAEKNFSLNKILNQYENFYQNILEKK